jgi:hypothetical protein
MLRTCFQSLALKFWVFGFSENGAKPFTFTAFAKPLSQDHFDIMELLPPDVEEVVLGYRSGTISIA